MTTSQNARILSHLRKGGTITGLQALKEFGCIHLPRRIKDLKERGHNIESQFIKVSSGKRVKEYWLT